MSIQENVNDRYFFCYDKNLSYHLYANGCRYITRAKNIKDDGQFALFEKTELLQRLVNEWSSNKVRSRQMG